MSEELTDEERDALKEVSKGMMQGIIPEHVKRKLADKGLIYEGLGGLGVTGKGQLERRKRRWPY